MKQHINYKKRWRSFVIFMFFFIGIPWRIEYISDEGGAWLLLLFSWIPGLLAAGWLEGWISLPDTDDKG